MKVAVISRPLFGYSAAEVTAQLAGEYSMAAAIPLADGGEVAAILPEIAPEVIWVQPEKIEPNSSPILIDTSTYGRLDGGRSWLEKAGGLTEAIADLAGLDITAITTEAESAFDLLGVRGVASRFGFEKQLSRQEILDLDEELAAFAVEVGVADRPGLGAAGGLPIALSAAGVPILSGLAWCISRTKADRLLAGADLVVVIVSRFDFGFHGGSVLSWVLQKVTDRPVVVVAPNADMGRREARNLGVEEVWSIAEPNLSGIADIGSRIGRVWGLFPG